MDRYYTPEPLARDLLKQCEFAKRACRVVDPSCGGGALLSAAESVLETEACTGIDLDRSTIRSLRVKKPHWHLSVADVLSEKSVRRSAAGRTGLTSNVVLLNPPFSQAGTKYVEFLQSNGEILRVSRAMRFLLQAAGLFKPADGMFAIVPESLVFSEIDAAGRRLMQSQYEMREIAELKSTTFKGARVRSIAVELSRRPQQFLTVRPNTDIVTTVKLERGSLPVHLALFARRGVPFVHSSDLKALASGTFEGRAVAAGRHSSAGWALLLPRVGVPKQNAVRGIHIRHPVRLSDCVLALWCEDRHSARIVENKIQERWSDFIGLYRGTGARYVTVARVTCWLAAHGVQVEQA